MDKYENRLNYNDEEKTEEFFKCVIKAVKRTREVVAKAEYRCRKIDDVLLIKNKGEMWNVLQEYIKKYPEIFEKKYGVVICKVDSDFYNRVSEQDIIKQLNIIKGIIYLREAQMCAAKETIRTCLKKSLDQSGMFDNKEIARLL